MATTKKITTVEELAKKMDLIANDLRSASIEDKEAILKEMDRLALDAAHLTSEEAVKLKIRLDCIGKQLSTASEAGFQSLSTQMKDSASEILNNIKEVKDGQERWGNRLLTEIGRIDSYVSTKVILIISILSIIAGTSVGIVIKRAASKVKEQIYNEDLTPIRSVPAFSKFSQVGLGIAFGILAAIIVFCVAHGVAKLIVRAKAKERK